ncbi:hypothetical protein [Neoroseomonas soli]|uniref:Uncharacterized protein n=1 Tax=Neoroseomonas soli TaxID=1081025 RepID=A0A9X9WVJ9_9PROT|nr:hypothetical protein [Neoroseomonas soli]MBR0671178.1 hypothetical protein [Neoroseomonas soli]
MTALAAGLALHFPEARTSILTWVRTKGDEAGAALITVLVTAFATILGILLTNKASADRARLQFDHERKSAERTQAYDLRREALLQSAETLQARLVALGTAARMDVSEMQIITLTKKQSASLARAYAVASDQTFLTLHRAQAALTLASGEVVIRHRIYARGKDSAVRTLQDGLDRLRSERATYLRWLQDPTMIRDPRDPVVQRLQERVRNLDAADMRQQDLLLAAQGESFKVLAAVAHAILDAAKKCEPVVIEAIIAIRKDLGVATDEARLTASLREDLERNTAKALGLLSHMDDLVNSFSNATTDAPPVDGPPSGGTSNAERPNS